MGSEPTPPLRGRLLVAAPPLVDPNFDRTVILVLEHGDEGSLGLVLNRPSATALADALDACAIPAWSQADARDWWRHHGDARLSGPTRVDPSSATQTMVVSLEDAAR